MAKMRGNGRPRRRWFGKQRGEAWFGYLSEEFESGDAGRADQKNRRLGGLACISFSSATMVATRRTRSAAAADTATSAVSDDGNNAKSAGISAAAAGDGDQEMTDSPPSETTSIRPAPAKNAGATDQDNGDDDEGGPRKRPRTEDTSADTNNGAVNGVQNSPDVADTNETSAEMEVDAGDDEKEHQKDADADADGGDGASEDEGEADEIEEYDESDDEVQIMSPPPKSQSQSQHSLSSSQQTGTAAGFANGDDAMNGDGTDDEIQIESCNVMNPTVHYAHTRDMCGVHRFDKEGKDLELNQLHCAKCYCFVCDVEADHARIGTSTATPTARMLPGRPYGR